MRYHFYCFMEGLRHMTIFYPVVIALAVLTIGSFWGPLAGQTPINEDKVVATVDGFAIRMSDVEGIRPKLPPQATQYPEKVVTNFLITTLIDTRLAAAEARRQGIDQDPAVKRRRGATASAKRTA